MARLIIYGAYGYTGRIACSHAREMGLNFVVAGRSASKVADLSAVLGVPSRVFDVDDASVFDDALQGTEVLLNCAGPYARTAAPLINACIRNKVHYLDIAAELESYKLAEQRDADAKEAGVMLLPGCGGSVAMLGCLASYAMLQVKDPVRVDVALHVSGPMSRGSAVSAAEGGVVECLQMLGGKLQAQDSSNTLLFDFGDGRGRVNCFPVTLPDLITMRKSTGVQDIGTYVSVSGDAFPSGDLTSLPDGPGIDQRDANPYHAAVYVTEADGHVGKATLSTMNGYSFTGLACVWAASQVLSGTVQAGFQTPAGLFGVQFLENMPASKLEYQQ